jgi:hypothetical protein
MIVANSLVALVYVFWSGMIRATRPSMPGWAFAILAIGGIVNVACAIGLLQWRKWGFYGFIASAAMAFVVNLTIGLGIIQALFGLAGVAVLYGVLNIGNEDKGWTQLE